MSEGGGIDEIYKRKATDAEAIKSLTDQMPPITPERFKKPKPIAVSAPSPEDRDKILERLRKETYPAEEDQTPKNTKKDES